MCRRWSVRIQYRSIRKSLNFLDPICLHDKISQKSVQIHEIMMNAVGGIRTWARTCAITCVTDHCTNKRRKKLARRRICSIWTVVLQCQGDSSQDFITPQEFVWQIHILILYGRSTYNFVRGIHIQILYGRFTYKICMAKSHTKKVHCISTVLLIWCLPRTFLGFVLLPEYRWRFFDRSAREVCDVDVNPLLKCTIFITAIRWSVLIHHCVQQYLYSTFWDMPELHKLTPAEVDLNLELFRVPTKLGP